MELCGALKNIIALACGIAGGLGYGDNTRAALITRGMAEQPRLGIAMGCQPRTFYQPGGHWRPDCHRHQPPQPQQPGR